MRRMRAAATVLPCAVFAVGCSGSENMAAKSATPAETTAPAPGWTGVCAVEAALLANPAPPAVSGLPAESELVSYSVGAYVRDLTEGDGTLAAATR